MDISYLVHIKRLWGRTFQSDKNKEECVVIDMNSDAQNQRQVPNNGLLDELSPGSSDSGQQGSQKSHVLPSRRLHPVQQHEPKDSSNFQQQEPATGSKDQSICIDKTNKSKPTQFYVPPPSEDQLVVSQQQNFVRSDGQELELCISNSSGLNNKTSRVIYGKVQPPRGPQPLPRSSEDVKLQKLLSAPVPSAGGCAFSYNLINTCPVDSLCTLATIYDVRQSPFGYDRFRQIVFENKIPDEVYNRMDSAYKDLRRLLDRLQRQPVDSAKVFIYQRNDDYRTKVCSTMNLYGSEKDRVMPLLKPTLYQIESCSHCLYYEYSIPSMDINVSSSKYKPSDPGFIEKLVEEYMSTTQCESIGCSGTRKREFIFPPTVLPLNLFYRDRRITFKDIDKGYVRLDHWITLQGEIWYQLGMITYHHLSKSAPLGHLWSEVLPPSTNFGDQKKYRVIYLADYSGKLFLPEELPEEKCKKPDDTLSYVYYVRTPVPYKRISA